MATLLERAYSNASAELRTRNCVACITTAQAVATESGTTPGNAERVVLAQRVLSAGPQQAATVAIILGDVLATVTDLATIQPDDAASDTALLNQVSAVWNGIAGVPVP